LKNRRARRTRKKCWHS